MEERQNLLESLNAIFSEVYVTALKPNNLRVAISDESKDAALMELLFLNDSEIGDNRFIQIYTTVSFAFNNEYTDKILDRLNELSNKCTIGNFGIYKPLNHIFHRYTMYIPNPDDIVCIHDISVVCDKIISTVLLLSDYISEIAQNPDSISLEEYLNNINNQQ